MIISSQAAERSSYLVLLTIMLLVALSFGPSIRPHLHSITLLNPSSHKPRPTWLLATMSPAHAQRRRNIIRATWQTLYQNPAFDTRFFVSNPGDLWRPLIQHENATYGDLIVLSDLEESKYVATHIKPLEFHKHIANSGLSWDYLAKLDDDSFLDAGTFYREFLLPDFQKAEQSQTPSRMMVARRLKRPTYPAPGGQFYSISWELVDLISRLYTESDIEGETEDVLVGRLLFEANEPFDWVELNDTRAFDIVEDLHQVGKMAINPHKMKDDETYLKVAQMYDSDGYRGERR